MASFGGGGAWAPSLRGKNRRVFLEIGAFDGVAESNTMMLERCLGWRGVLVEANPVAWAALKEAGRTHSTLVHAAPICQRHGDRNETVRMSSIPFTNAMMDPTRGPRAEVPCVSLTMILRKALGPRPRIDFFSLDVENAEEAVLATLDLKAVDVALIFVEVSNSMCRPPECPKQARIRALLAAAGYKLNPFTVRASDVFVREDLMPAKRARRLLRAARP